MGMNKDNDYDILEAMSVYGGSFVKNIAAAARSADASNYAKLKAAFPEIWNQYEAFAKVMNRTVSN